MTFRVSVTSENIIEVEYFGVTTYADRGQALDALAAVNVLPAPKRVLVNFLGANVVDRDDARRLDFIAKAVAHPVLDNTEVALVGLSHTEAHPAETAGVVRLIKVRAFKGRDEAVRWLLGE